MERSDITHLSECHPRMFLSGVQSCMAGFPTEAFGNDNLEIDSRFRGNDE